MLKYVKSQEEMDLARAELSKTGEYQIAPNTRKVLHKMRYGMFNFVSRVLYGILLLL